MDGEGGGRANGAASRVVSVGAVWINLCRVEADFESFRRPCGGGFGVEVGVGGADAGGNHSVDVVGMAEKFGVAWVCGGGGGSCGVCEFSLGLIRVNCFT